MSTISEFDINTLAVPTEDEVSAWNALTREQQLKALQAVSHHPDSTTPSGRSMGDIKQYLRSRRLQQA